jgi:Na+/H+-dicarboxylate symporter
MQKSKITLYIFIALILGVIIGYIYNVHVIGDINSKISTADANIKNFTSHILTLKDTSTAEYKILRNQKNVQVIISNTNNALRDAKLQWFTILSDIFLRLIKMIIGPLVFTTLVVGVAKLGDIRSVGRIGGKTLLWFISASLISLLIGMLFVNFFQPGETMHLPLPDSHLSTDIKPTGLTLKDFVGHVFPRSFFEAMTNNEMLQIVVFSLFFGVATAAIGTKGETIIKAMDAFAQVILKVTSYVMVFAPLAVFGSITAVVAKQGLGIVSTYAAFIGEFYFSLVLLWLVIIFAGFIVLRKRIITLVNYVKDAMLVAFATSSSEAAYPKLLLELEHFGCNNKIVSFVLPLGYSFNLDGSMMYMTFASLFLAQAYNIHLTFGQQITMLLILMLTSKGVAGVPRASLVVLAVTVPIFHIPEAGIALLLGIDPILDMGRSATNVLGNGIATAVVSKWEGELTNGDMALSEEAA